MPSRRAALLALALAAVAGAGGWWWRQRATDGAPLRAAPRDDAADDERVRTALALAASATATVPVEPWGLTARPGARFVCAVSEHDLVTRCESPGWLVTWDVSVEPERIPAHERQRVARATMDQDGKEGGGAPTWVGTLTLAGFSGWLDTTRGARRPGRAWEFQGWYDDPARGQLRLDVRADATEWGENLESLEGLALVLTTATEGARRGPAASWPDAETRPRLARVVRSRRTLERDDAPPSDWAEAVRALGDVDHPSVAAARAELGPLAERRVVELGGRDQPLAFRVAVDVAFSLRQWERAGADRALTALEERGRERGRTPGGPTWAAQRVYLGWAWWRREQAGPVTRLAPDLADEDPLQLAREPTRPLALLLRASSVPEVRRLLDAWSEGPLRAPPDDAPFAALAELCAFAPSEPTARALAERLLQRRTPYGALIVEGGSTHVRTPEGGDLRLGAGQPSSDGTPLRVADHCAHHLSSQIGAPAFALTDPVGVRDRAIAAQRAWLTRRPR